MRLNIVSGHLRQPGGDLQNSVFNVVNQTTRLSEQQIQCTSQSNTVDIDADSLIHHLALRFHGLSLQCDIHSPSRGDVTNDVRQRCIMEVQ